MAPKIILGRRNFIEFPGVTFTPGGAAWPQPLTNLADIRPQFVAEAASNAASNTLFTVDLLTPRIVGAFSFLNLRMSSVGTIRVQASLTNGGTILYDTTVVKGWPQDTTPGGVNPWGITTADGTYNAEFYLALGNPRIFVPPAPVTVQFIYVTISDETLVSPLQIGCMGAWEIWQPPRNLSYGWAPKIYDLSDVREVPGGSTYRTRRVRKRGIDFGFKLLNQEEFFARGFDYALTRGRVETCLVVPFPDDTPNIEKVSVWGLMSSEGQFSNEFFAEYQTTFSVRSL